MEAGGFIYDTHAAVRRLTAAGFSERQAEAIAGENLRRIGHNFATRADSREVLHKIEKSRLATKADIATAKTSTIIWIVGLVAGLKAAMLGIPLLAMAWLVDTLLKAQ